MSMLSQTTRLTSCVTANTLSVIAELVCHYELQGCRFVACQCRMQSGAKELR